MNREKNKKCIVCGFKIFKPLHCNKKEWDNRKFCSHQCQYKGQINNLKDVWKYIDIKGEDDCWEWLGHLVRGNYGSFGINKKYYRSHRLAYTETYGPIPEGMFILHKCNNPKCCNPKHLYAGTQKDNMEQCKNDGRVAMGEKHYKSKLTEENVLKIRSLYSTGNYYQRELGKIFGVGDITISDITRRKTWKYI